MDASGTADVGPNGVGASVLPDAAGAGGSWIFRPPPRRRDSRRTHAGGHRTRTGYSGVTVLEPDGFCADTAPTRNFRTAPHSARKAELRRPPRLGSAAPYPRPGSRHFLDLHPRLNPAARAAE